MTDHEYPWGGTSLPGGRGSFCDVFVESDECGTPARVCKVLPARRASNAVYQRALESEIAVLARLDHRGLPCLQAADPSAREPWLQYRYLPGETVARRARGAGDAMARRVGGQLLQHLDYLHREVGVVHGDIAATNVLVHGRDTRCSVSLIDFGNAWSFRFPWRRLPQRAYRAPEQSAGQPWAAAADIFQVGIVIHEILTGVRPYRTGAREDLRGPLPLGWQPWLEQVLHPDPELRPDAGGALSALPSGSRRQVIGIGSFLQPRLRRRTAAARS